MKINKTQLWKNERFLLIESSETVNQIFFFFFPQRVSPVQIQINQSFSAFSSWN